MRRGRVPAQHEVGKDGWLSTSTVLELTGITMRQLQYWVDRGKIDPEGGGGEGRGRPRRWSVGDVELIRDMLHRIEECPYDHPGRKR